MDPDSDPLPADEICRCTDDPPIVLQAHFSPTPLACMRCNLEVPVERLGLSAALAEELAGWARFHDCFYLLWIDSQEYEYWAWAQLTDPGSPLHTRALDLVARLQAFRPTYYGWFSDGEAEDEEVDCPLCRGPLAERLGWWVCEDCAVAGRGGDGPEHR